MYKSENYLHLENKEFLLLDKLREPIRSTNMDYLEF